MLPEEYAQKVFEYSQRSLEDTKAASYTYSDLASFLRSPYAEAYLEKLPVNSRGEFEHDLAGLTAHQSIDFARSHTFQSGAPSAAKRLGLPLERLTGDESSVSNRLIFLRGYPSAEWLNRLGSHYAIDPRFFLHHLQFRSSGTESNQRTTFASPSSQQTIFRLNLITVGEHSQCGDMKVQQEDAARKMNSYLHTLRTRRGWTLGDSIVRSYDVLSERLFSIEQFATVHLARNSTDSDKWTSMLILKLHGRANKQQL